MDRLGTVADSEAALARWGRAAAAVVLVVAALKAINWAAGVWRSLAPASLSAPWTSLWLAGLATATLLQSGQPPRGRVRLGRMLAAGVGVLAAAVLAERLAVRTLGLDPAWWHTAHSAPPSPRGASSILYLSAAIVLMRVDRRGTGLPWRILLVAALAAPVVTLLGHMFKAASAASFTESTGQGISTAIAIVLLVAATVAARPDRNPAAWLLARPDRWALIRLAIVLCGLPVLVGLGRLPFLAFGLGSDAAWILATTIATLVVGAAVFYLSQREQRLLIEEELLSRQRAEAEKRYRILADNAVDVIFHLDGSTVIWASPSVEAAFGEPAQAWIGADLSARVHPDDLETVEDAIGQTGPDKPVLARFRVLSANGGYHWVDGHAKPYVEERGKTDGLIAALRIVDDQVEAEHRLDRLARYDTVTGLSNRAELISRLESALQQPRNPGSHLGLLFCDVDHFKLVNDTLGHAVGDVVLATLAARIRESIRQGDSVGRTGGDEMVVLLPGVHSLDEAARIGEKIRSRAAEPIHHDGLTIHATLSIGATISLAGESAIAVTARADAAMYQAKSNNRNNVVRIDPSQESWGGDG